jgi:hypothetical protein
VGSSARSATASSHGRRSAPIRGSISSFSGGPFVDIALRGDLGDGSMDQVNIRLMKQ